MKQFKTLPPSAFEASHFETIYREKVFHLFKNPLQPFHGCFPVFAHDLTL